MAMARATSRCWPKDRSRTGACAGSASPRRSRIALHREWASVEVSLLVQDDGPCSSGDNGFELRSDHALARVRVQRVQGVPGSRCIESGLRLRCHSLSRMTAHVLQVTMDSNSAQQEQSQEL